MPGREESGRAEERKSGKVQWSQEPATAAVLCFNGGQQCDALQRGGRERERERETEKRWL